MKDFKIITPGAGLPDVLIHRAIDDDGFDQVVIITFGVVDGVEDTMITEDIMVENAHTAQLIIKTFDESSATLWCHHNEIDS